MLTRESRLSHPKSCPWEVSMEKNLRLSPCVGKTRNLSSRKGKKLAEKPISSLAYVKKCKFDI